MAGWISKFLDDWHLRKVQERWSSQREAAAGFETIELRALRGQARTLRRSIDRVIHAADQRLNLPLLSAGLPRAPLGTDWAWRADVWRGPLAQTGMIALEKRTQISDDLALFHDCPLAEISVRQLRNGAEADRAPFGLALEVFGFKGSFLSLAISLPVEAVSGLKSVHVIRLDAVIDADQPVKAFARLNIKHGPNVAQLVQGLPEDGRNKMVEFDLVYGKIDDSRIESAWIDVIFNNPGLARITLRDVVASRRPRAEA